MLAWSAAWAATSNAPAAAGADTVAWLHVSKTIRVNAPADMVWNAVKDFDAINTWHPAVDKDEIVEGKNNKAGAVRLLTLKGGGTIKERLLRF
ncbi:MAG: SRPBCC family protein, partial [Steroidobacteraceae bacterium]